MFRLKFVNQECWIAPWDGDPGRTLVRKVQSLLQLKNQLKKKLKKLKTLIITENLI